MDKNLPTTNPLCAIQIITRNISNSNATLTFMKNTAKLAGNSVYVSPLYDCKQTQLNEVNLSDTYNKIFYFYEYNHIGEISSVAVRTNFCSINNKSIKVYPGENIRIGLRAFDLNGNPTYAQILARLTTLGMRWSKKHRCTDITDISHLLHIEQQIQTVYSNNCTFLNFTIYLLENKNNLMYSHFEVLG